MTTMPTVTTKPPHPDEAAFQSAIVANPNDDTARLAYADWLDENDRPDRAAEIRIENLPYLEGRSREARRWQRFARLQLAPIVPVSWKPWVIDGPTSPRWIRHTNYDEPGAPRTWTRFVAGFMHIGPIICCLRHGYIAGIALPENGLVKYARSIVAAHPVQWIGMTTKQPLDLEVAGGVVFAWVRANEGQRPALSTLPPRLFALVREQSIGSLLHHRRRDCVGFPTRTAAYTALEVALLKFCRPNPQMLL